MLALSYSCLCSAVKKRIGHTDHLFFTVNVRYCFNLLRPLRRSPMEEIRIVDTTLRDGNTSLWAHNMTTG